MNQTHYPAKLLLLGEYTVLKGSSALAVPLREYDGRWVERQGESPIWLTEFIDFLLVNCSDLLDAARLLELADRWSFQLTIPIGYGLGSSGALVAAVYDCARTHKSDDLPTLMEEMGRMESFFHGKSSGFDPLVSYLGQGVIKTHDQGFALWEANNNPLLSRFNRVDSGVARNDKKELIPSFLRLCEKEPRALSQLIRANNKAIEALMSQRTADLVQELRTISAWQWRYMQAWISPNMRDKWNNSDAEIYKICGAGGGGFFLKYLV